MTLPKIAPRARDAHKGDFGRILLVGGSRGMAGSIALSSMAALRSGAGLVTAAVPDVCLETVASWEPCLMTTPLANDPRGCFATDAAEQLTKPLQKCDAAACGPGLNTGVGSIAIVNRLLECTTLPRVFDADALNVLSALKGWDRGPLGPLVLTPHPGELQRLTGVSAKSRDEQVQAARQLAARTQAVIVVKGGPTVVTDGMQMWTSETGNPGMATAGCGDVLTGITAALLGQGWFPWDAARLAVHVHGLAGDLAAEELGEIGMTARDLLNALPYAFQQLVG